MKLIEQIENILKTQSEYLILAETYVPFLKKVKNLKNGEFLERPYLEVVIRLVKCDLVLVLSVLCDYNSDFSFSKLNNIVSRLPKIKGLTVEEKSILCSMLDQSINVYGKLELKYIRDKYCAHLDKKRDSRNLDLESIENLIHLLQDIHTLCSNSIMKENVGFNCNKNVLTELLDDNKLLFNYLSNRK